MADAILERDRVLAMLEPDGRLLPLTVLSAPAGYGKTTVLQQFLSRHAGPVTVWQAGEGDVGDVERSAGPGGVVVVDDAHRLGPSRLAHLVERIDVAATALRPDVHPAWVLAGRDLRMPGLARQVAHGTARRIDRDALAFDDAEIRRLAVSVGAFADRLDDLHRWPALARRALLGDERAVVDYLLDVVVPEAPSAVVDLLAGICVGGDGSAEAVEAVAEALGLGGIEVSAVADLPLVRGVDAEVGAGGVVVDRRWTAVLDRRLPERSRRDVRRSLASVLHARGELVAAGDMAVAAGAPEVLTAVARSAMDGHPAAVGVEVLERWAAVPGMDPVERRWMLASAGVVRHPTSARVAADLDYVREAFAASGDVAGEVPVLFVSGVHARRRSDLAGLVRLVERVRTLDPALDPRLAVLDALGEAVGAQIRGEPDRALAALAEVPLSSLDARWRAQVEMVRATNLLLVGDGPGALDAYQRVTAVGSPLSRAVAHDLASAARWSSGDLVGARRDAEAAVSLVEPGVAPALLDLHRAWRGCLAALDGGPTTTSPRPVADGSEASRLRAVALAVERIEGGDLGGAAAALAGLEVGPHPRRSSILARALLTGLGAEPRDEPVPAWSELAHAAGRAAARFLAGGPVPAPVHRPYLPRCWWGPHGRRVRVELLAGPRVLHDGSVIADSGTSWSRRRVRELLAHLVLVPDASRSRRATDLWPDLSDERAAANLRVTLTQLLDVIDPDRPRGEGSELVDDGAGSLRLRIGPRLSSDVHELRGAAERCRRALAAGDRSAALAWSRRMVEVPVRTALVDGGDLGGWADLHRRALEDLVAGTLVAVAAVAIDEGESTLAEAAAALALVADPWSEAAGCAIASARLAVGDSDGARRALGDVLSRLDQLDVVPAPATRALSARLGVSERRP